MKSIRILLVIAVILGLSGCRNRLDEYSVMKGTFRQSFMETGELEAISSVAILMAQIKWEYGYEYKIIEMAQTGRLVQEGDTVIRVDGSSIEKMVITTQEKLDNEKATTKKLQVQMDNNIQELKAQLRTEQAMYDLRKLELDRSKFDSENNRKIKDLEFRQATIRMEKIKRQLANRPVMDNYDYRIQKIKEKQVEAELEGAKGVLAKMVITSPKAGMFQAGYNEQYYPPRYLKAGDQAHPGMMVAKIPDINRMKVRTFVNETDITKISRGLKVIVRLDALPQLAFNGSITDIGKVCVPMQGEKSKVFKVIVEIAESDLRLKPGMTVSCEYISSEMENALYVPNNCLMREENKFYVFLKKGGIKGKTEVQAGPSNSHYTLIKSGPEPGTALIPVETVLNKKTS